MSSTGIATCLRGCDDSGGRREEDPNASTSGRIFTSVDAAKSFCRRPGLNYSRRHRERRADFYYFAQELSIDA